MRDPYDTYDHDRARYSALRDYYKSLCDEMRSAEPSDRDGIYQEILRVSEALQRPRSQR